MASIPPTAHTSRGSPPAGSPSEPRKAPPPGQPAYGGLPPGADPMTPTPPYDSREGSYPRGHPSRGSWMQPSARGMYMPSGSQWSAASWNSSPPAYGSTNLYSMAWAQAVRSAGSEGPSKEEACGQRGAAREKDEEPGQAGRAVGEGAREAEKGEEGGEEREEGELEEGEISEGEEGGQAEEEPGRPEMGDKEGREHREEDGGSAHREGAAFSRVFEGNRMWDGMDRRQGAAHRLDEERRSPERDTERDWRKEQEWRANWGSERGQRRESPRERKRGWEGERERYGDKEREPGRERLREWEREEYRERDRDREREEYRERERERDSLRDRWRVRERERELDWDNRERDKEREREREREKETEKGGQGLARSLSSRVRPDVAAWGDTGPSAGRVPEKDDRGPSAKEGLPERPERERARQLAAAALLLKNTGVKDAQRSLADVCDRMRRAVGTLAELAEAEEGGLREGLGHPLADVTAVSRQAFSSLRAVFAVANTAIGREQEGFQGGPFSSLLELVWTNRRKMFTKKQAGEIEGMRQSFETSSRAARAEEMSRREREQQEAQQRELQLREQQQQQREQEQESLLLPEEFEFENVSPGPHELGSEAEDMDTAPLSAPASVAGKPEDGLRKLFASLADPQQAADAAAIAAAAMAYAQSSGAAFATAEFSAAYPAAYPTSGAPDWPWSQAAYSQQTPFGYPPPGTIYSAPSVQEAEPGLEAEVQPEPHPEAEPEPEPPGQSPRRMSTAPPAAGVSLGWPAGAPAPDNDRWQGSAAQRPAVVEEVEPSPPGVSEAIQQPIRELGSAELALEDSGPVSRGQSDYETRDRGRAEAPPGASSGWRVGWEDVSPPGVAPGAESIGGIQVVESGAPAWEDSMEAMPGGESRGYEEQYTAPLGTYMEHRLPSPTPGGEGSEEEEDEEDLPPGMGSNSRTLVHQADARAVPPGRNPLASSAGWRLDQGGARGWVPASDFSTSVGGSGGTTWESAAELQPMEDGHLAPLDLNSSVNRSPGTRDPRKRQGLAAMSEEHPAENGVARDMAPGGKGPSEKHVLLCKKRKMGPGAEGPTVLTRTAPDEGDLKKPRTAERQQPVPVPRNGMYASDGAAGSGSLRGRPGEATAGALRANGPTTGVPPPQEARARPSAAAAPYGDTGMKGEGERRRLRQRDPRRALREERGGLSPSSSLPPSREDSPVGGASPARSLTPPPTNGAPPPVTSRSLRREAARGPRRQPRSANENAVIAGLQMVDPQDEVGAAAVLATAVVGIPSGSTEPSVAPNGSLLHHAEPAELSMVQRAKEWISHEGTSGGEAPSAELEALLEGMSVGERTAILAERRRRMEEQGRMLRAGKLCLVLDLDHTLLNSAKFSEVEAEWEQRLRAAEGQERSRSAWEGGRSRELYRFPHMAMWTKLRPGIWTFLARASALFELHVYTMGNRAYATEMARLLDPSGALFAGRVISKGDDNGSEGSGERDGRPKSKDLDGVLGMESSVLILDDSASVWPHHATNLIVVERYMYFPCSRRQFGLPGPSLLEVGHDEREADGMLASAMGVMERIHRAFFEQLALKHDADVRDILATEQRRILASCRILFSRVFPVGEARPHLHPLWRMAEQFGATCTTTTDEAVTHVVAVSPGTDKVNWALATGRHVVRPAWLEASAILYRRGNEGDFRL